MKRLAVASVAVFLGLLLTRWERMKATPYGEHAFGLWTEASYLADHDFSYSSLMGQPHGANGGPRNYLTIATPTFLAAIMRLTSPPRTALFAHLINFLLSSIVVGSVFAFLRSRGTVISTLAAVALVSNPVFSVQIEMTSLDMLMTAFLIPSATCLAWDRPKWGILAAIPAFFAKNSAALVMPAIGILESFRFIADVRAGRPAIHRLVTVAVSVIVFIAQFKFLQLGSNSDTRVRPVFSDVELVVWSIPFEIILVGVGALLSIVAFVLDRHGKALSTRESNLLSFGGVFSLIYLAAMSILVFEARYIVVLLPIMMIWISIQSCRVCGTRAGIGTLLMVIAFNLSHADGSRLTPGPCGPGSLDRGWGVPERSHEYRLDHRSHLEMTRVLSKCKEPMLLSDQFIYFLQLPRLGYVERPMAGDPPPYRFAARFDNLREVLYDRPESIVVAYVPSQLSFDDGFPFMIDKPGVDDEILFNDFVLPANVVYRRIIDQSLSSHERIRRYVDLVFSQDKEVDPAVRLAWAGYFDLARQYVKALDPTNEEEQVINRNLHDRLRPFIMSPKRERDGRLSERDRVREYLSYRAIQHLGEKRDVIPPSWEERGIDSLMTPRIFYRGAESSMKEPGGLEGLSD